MQQHTRSFLDKVMNVPWWMNAGIGAILLLGSDDLTGLKVAGLPLEWAPRYIKLLGCIFLACAVLPLLLRAIGTIYPEDPVPSTPGPGVPPPAAKKKYSERDFMPPELRAQDAPADPDPKP